MSRSSGFRRQRARFHPYHRDMAPPSGDRVADAAARLRAELARRIVGMEEVVEQALWCVASGSHGLLVGVPGLAKTLLVSSLAELLDLRFRRVQFTPHPLPSDLLGAEILA